MNESFPDHMNAGMKFLREGTPAQAIHEFQQAVELAPQDESAVIALIIAFYTVGEYTEALKAYDVFLEQKGEKHASDTIKLFHKVLDEGSSLFKTCIAAGRAYQAYRQPLYAVEMFFLATQEDKYSDEAIRALMSAYQIAGNTEAALQTFEDFADFLAKERKEPSPETIKLYNMFV